MSVTQGLLINWQKSYGQLLVTSDTFHANIGIFTNLCNGACRIVWGLIYDRIGYKNCMLIISACVTLAVSALPALKLLGKSVAAGRSRAGSSLLRSQPRPDFLRHPGVLLHHHHRVPGRQLCPPTHHLLPPPCQVDVLFHLLGYSGMFVMAGAAAASGLLVTVFMAEDIKYERENKRQSTQQS